jgi:regulator of sigma E protease
MNVFLAVLGLAFLILIHEAGHFLVALAVGMRPRSFNLGFGPPLAKITRKGIDYALRPIPLGGYVKIPGMHRPAPADLDVFFSRAVHEAPELTGPVERVRRRLTASTDPPPEARADVEELRAVVEAADLKPDAAAPATRGLQELADGLGSDAYWRQRTWKRIAVILAGPVTNLALAVVVFAALFMVGDAVATRVVDSVLPGHPAAAAGLRAGDRIVAINGRPVRPTEIPERIQGSGGRPIKLTVERGERRLVLGPVRARKDAGVYRLGFRLRGRSLGAAAAFWRSVKLTGIVTREIGKSLARLVHESGRKEISGTVGIVQSSSNALSEGVQTYLWVIGLISLSLALFNLLPLLPLDGGHIVFSLIEGVRGRAVGRAIYERVSAIGIALVLLLFVIGLSNDIDRLNGG